MLLIAYQNHTQDKLGERLPQTPEQAEEREEGITAAGTPFFYSGFKV